MEKLKLESEQKSGQSFASNPVDADIQIVQAFDHPEIVYHQVDADIQIVEEFDHPEIVYQQVDADIQIVEEFDPLGVENNHQEIDEFENVLDERQPSDPNDNPKYSKAIKKKLELIKKNKLAYYEATKDWDKDLFKEGQEVQKKYQEFNWKANRGCFCLYNPFELKEFIEEFTKFRKELKCTQEDVRRDLGKYMKKPLTTLTISKFENGNLTGTKMTGIKKLLEFWMKLKNVEKNRESVLMAKQIKMLEDREVVQQALRNVHDVDRWPSMVEEVGVDLEETARAEVMAMETEPAPIRFNYEDGKLTRVFDCAEVKEKVVMNLGVREKLAQLQIIENIRKEEERRIKKRYTSKNGRNMGVQKKRGRPVKNFKRGTTGKNSSLKRLKSGEHGKMKKTDGKAQHETANVRKRGRAKNPVEMEETVNIKRWRKKEPVGSAPPLFRRSIMTKRIKEKYNKCKEKEQNGVDYLVKDMGETKIPVVASEKLVCSIEEDKIFQDMHEDFLGAMALSTTMESLVDLDKVSQMLRLQQEENHIIGEFDVEVVTTFDCQQLQPRDDMAPNHYDNKPVYVGADSLLLHDGGEFQQIEIVPHNHENKPLDVSGGILLLQPRS